MLAKEPLEMIEGDCLVGRKIDEPVRGVDQRQLGTVCFADLLDDLHGVSSPATILATVPLVEKEDRRKMGAARNVEIG